jgi:putative flippase GtrA
MSSAARIALIYALVSGLVTVVNIATQAAVVSFFSGPWVIQLSVLLGTATGFPIKYVLEKKYVFDFHADNLVHDTRLFILYGYMSVFTTLIFWGIEWAFHVVFETDAMRYLGGAIGLTVGSFIKYHLDKRFVFKKESV